MISLLKSIICFFFDHLWEVKTTTNRIVMEGDIVYESDIIYYQVCKRCSKGPERLHPHDCVEKP